MFRWIVALAVWLAVVSFSVAAPAQFTGTEYINGLKLQGHEYMDSTGSVTLAWDAIPANGITDPVWYDVRVIMFDKSPETAYAIGLTTLTDMEILRPRSGHFRFEVRACRYSDCHCEPDSNSDICEDDRSDWAQSTDPTQATVDGVAMGWWVYFKTPPPIIIENF